MKNDVAKYLKELRKQQSNNVKFLVEADPGVSPAPPENQVTDAPPEEQVVDPVADDQNVSQEAVADMQMGSITLEMIIDKFNTIRAGRSFKDKSIKQQMMTYFEKLSDEEKLSLYAFLKGISQIVSGEFTGYDPVKPSDVPPGGAPAPTPPEGDVPPSPAPDAAAAPPAAPAQPPTPAAPPPAQNVAPPVKKVIKTVKPNIIRMSPVSKNSDGSVAPIPITPKVRK